MDETLKQKIIKAQEGDKLVLNELVEDNCGLIYSIIKRFENRGCEREDERTCCGGRDRESWNHRCDEYAALADGGGGSRIEVRIENDMVWLCI